MAPALEDAPPGRGADRLCGHGRTPTRRAIAGPGRRARRDRRAGRPVRARRAALRARAGRPRAVARVLPRAPRRSPRGDRQRSGRARARRVAARGGDPRRAAAAQAERGARRPRIRARNRAGAHQRVIRWEAPGPYEVVFTTRVGGVSDGPYASLNLGRRTGDEVERVDENRRRACAEIGVGAEWLALNYQVHSALVHRAVPGERGHTQGDGLWTEDPNVPILALAADCVPI